MIVDDAPDYAVDIPLIWQYIGEIIGKFFFHTNISLEFDSLRCIDRCSNIEYVTTETSFPIYSRR
jgi:hypothetical protein